MVSWNIKKKKSVLLISCMLIILIFSLFYSYNYYRKNNPENNHKSTSLVAGAETSIENPASLPSTTPIPTSPLSTNRIYLGAWTQGLFDSTSDTLNPQALRDFETMIGRKVAIAHYYRGWHTLDTPKFLSELNNLSSNGWSPMISANPYFFDQCVANGLTLYKAISDGNCDNFIHSMGKNLASYAKPVFFRFAWEMNTDSMGWSISKTGDSTEDFKTAWQRIHEIFYQENAKNVLFVFCPNVGGKIRYSQIYPGDSFVDWVCLDGYNWGNTQSWSRWEDALTIFSNSYSEIVSAAPNKPVMIGETNSTDRGGNKAEWYKNAFQMFPEKLLGIKAIVIYNEDRSAKENVNWLINASNDSLNAFRQGINSSSYLSSF